MLEPKSHSLTSERFLINQESILTHKNGIFIDWVRQPLWRDLRDYWVNMWYKSACLRRFFFFWFSHLMCSRWMNWRQRSTGTKLFSVQFSKPQLKLSQIFLENTLGLVLPAQSWPFFSKLEHTHTFHQLILCNFFETRPFCLDRKSFYSDVFVCFFVLLGTNDEAHHFYDEIIFSVLNFPESTEQCLGKKGIRLHSSWN